MSYLNWLDLANSTVFLLVIIMNIIQEFFTIPMNLKYSIKINR